MVDSAEQEILPLKHHAKSRYGGRVSTEPQRVAAAEAIVGWIAASDYRDRVILLGDFNDNPDDASSNTLEMGARDDRRMENAPGPFLRNLTEPLLLGDAVSYGLNTRNVTSTARDAIDHQDVGSRLRNLEQYDDETNVGRALYDQILVSPSLVAHLAHSEAQLFDDAVAIAGNDDTRASDHVPVSIAFRPAPLQAVAVLPDPAGADHDREVVTLRNTTARPLHAAIELRDASGFVFATEIAVDAGASIDVTPSAPPSPSITAATSSPSGRTGAAWTALPTQPRRRGPGSHASPAITEPSRAAVGDGVAPRTSERGGTTAGERANPEQLTPPQEHRKDDLPDRETQQ